MNGYLSSRVVQTIYNGSYTLQLLVVEPLWYLTLFNI